MKVVYFFKNNPNPNDEQFHQWAESEGLDVHKAEEAAYFLATRCAWLLTEGKAPEKGVTPKDVDPEQLKMGIEVEKEHIRSCPRIAKKIALDHLAEIPDYYTRLDKMEREAGVEHH